MRLLGPILACLALGACAPPWRAVQGLRAPREGICRDGLPMRVLVDVECPGGVCGFSCVPGRWKLKETDR